MVIDRTTIADSGRRVLEVLPAISASVLKNRMGMPFRWREEGVAITRHNRAEFVLLTAAKYLELRKADQAPLENLAAQFDAMVAKMNAPEGKRGVADLFAATPGELGASAVDAARSDGR